MNNIQTILAEIDHELDNLYVDSSDEAGWLYLLELVLQGAKENGYLLNYKHVASKVYNPME